jgi:hypothetical protein
MQAVNTAIHFKTIFVYKVFHKKRVGRGEKMFISVKIGCCCSIHPSPDFIITGKVVTPPQYNKRTTEKEDYLPG